MVLEGRLGEARELYLGLCRSVPDERDAWIALSEVSRKLGNLKEAEKAARHVLSRHPQEPAALHVLGAVLQRLGRADEAMDCYRKALQAGGNNADTHYFLANALREKGFFADAESEYGRVIAVRPDHVEALNNLSALLTNRGKTGRAAGLLKQALRISPDSPQLLINYGRLCLHTGEAGEAAAAFRKVLAMQPGWTDVHSNLLACLNYLPDSDPAEVFAEHCRWQELHGDAILYYTDWGNLPDPGRKLRIGYVSPDLCEHSVARFLEPVLAGHDREHFEVVCYSDVLHPDATTARLRRLCGRWVDVRGKTHEQLAGLVRQDGIDILVDLAGHTANNRLPVFAGTPAPVQVTWLGYPNTTGLRGMDYRLTDAVADPPGETENLHTETLLRLPHGFLCYHCPEDAPEAGPLPCSTTGQITFGSFNNLAKTSPGVIRVWSRVLNAVPGSRLMLKSRATGDPDVRQRLIDAFARLGIRKDRVGFLEPVPSHHDHMAAYKGIDIALDTFPYNGTTTSCEALWMGVPVITLAGKVHAGRVGASLLSRVGLIELVAPDANAYVAIAVRLSGDTGRLASIRGRLRETMRNSRLCDATGFTGELEQAFRTMWTDWCRERAGDG